MDESTTESTSSSNVSVQKGLGKRAKRENWPRNKKKRKRAQGKGYVAKNNVEVPAKKFVHIVHCCHRNCHQKLNLEKQKEKFKSFYTLTKEDQDTFLMSCIEKVELTVAKTNPISKKRNYSWNYHIHNEKQIKERVCKSFLQNLYQVTESRICTVLQFCKQGALVATENRGKHSNRPNRIQVDVWKMIEDHWASFPSKKSHYCAKKTEKKYFDNPDLNVKVLYELFKEDFKNKTGKDATLKYDTYYRYFRENSKYSFRSPKTDICDFCAKCKVKLNADPDDPCKEAFRCHLEKVKKYNELRKKYVLDKENNNNNVYSDTLVLEFDYAQNLALPKLNINSSYYKRILNLYTFNIHCFNDNDSKMFCFLECDGKKDSNSVCSFLDDFIKKKLSANSSLKKINLFSDAAGGQNKNLNVVKFCTWFARTNKVKITHIFPVRGHSYCQCDRNFGMYGTILKRKERIESPDDYLNIMRVSRKNPKPFEAELSASLLKDWSTALKLIYKNTPKLKKNKFSIQKYVKIEYTENSEVLVYHDYNSNCLRFNNSCKSSSALQFSPLTKPGITEEKKKDLLFFVEYLSQENRKWLLDVLQMEEKDLQPDDIMSDEESEFED